MRKTERDGRHRRTSAPKAIALAVLSMAWAFALAAPFPVPASADGPRADTTPPAAITGLAASDARDGSVNLTWTPSADGDFAHYSIYFDRTSFLTLGNRTPAATLDNISARSFTVSNLTNGVQYFFAVTAVDASGNEERTVVSVSATPTASSVPDTTPPQAVAALTAADAHDGKVNLTWTPVSAPDFARYVVYVTTRSRAPVSELSPALNITNISNARATVSGLQDNVTYYFAVTAADLSGNENRTALAGVSATPTPTPPPVVKPPRKPSEPAQADTTLFYAVLIVALSAVATYLALDRALGSWRPPAAKDEDIEDAGEDEDEEE